MPCLRYPTSETKVVTSIRNGTWYGVRTSNVVSSFVNTHCRHALPRSAIGPPGKIIQSEANEEVSKTAVSHTCTTLSLRSTASWCRPDSASSQTFLSRVTHYSILSHSYQPRRLSVFLWSPLTTDPQDKGNTRAQPATTMSASLPGIRELPESQYDLSTYWGRVRQTAGITDPR